MIKVPFTVIDDCEAPVIEGVHDIRVLEFNCDLALARLIDTLHRAETFVNLSSLFLIKNLETVQGDERDVILFSVGYGKDEDGNV